MPIFELKKISAVKGREDFYKLIKDSECFFDAFQSEIKEEGQYTAQLKTILTWMELVANLNRVPNTKFKPITPDGDNVKEYEFKSRNLRVYVFHLERTGKIVVLGGYKNTQKSDIKRFRNLKYEFLESYRE